MCIRDRNKTDLIYEPESDPVQRLKDEFEPKGIRVFPISGATGKGISELLYYVSSQLEQMDTAPVIFEQEYFPDDELIYEDLPYTCLLYTSDRKRIPGLERR